MKSYQKFVKMTSIQLNNQLKEEDDDIPVNIGPYEIIKKITNGGYSKIYLALSKYTGEHVVIKAINKIPFQQNIEDLLLLVKQTEILKLLKHRNIVSLYEIYESPKFFYLIMEYLPQGDLITKIIKQKRFTEEEAKIIFTQLIDALYYMHKMNICHRDIRPEHILFDKNNKPKLIGFSYSTLYKKDININDSYGSLLYACPEIIQGDLYDPEMADVWSMGVLLYVMVCGYLPFSDESNEQNKILIVNGKVDYPKEISNKLKDLLKHMLDIDPTKRYGLLRIIKHPFFKPVTENMLTGGCNIYKMIYPIDEKILNIIVIYGFNKKEVDMDLKQNKFNIGTGLYKQILRKVLDLGLISISDLCCEDFINFKNDNANYFSDGDKKYQKYFDKIMLRTRKVEIYINDFQQREENVIQTLDYLKNANLNNLVIETKKTFKPKNNKISNNNGFDPLKKARKSYVPNLSKNEQESLRQILLNINENKNKKNEEKTDNVEKIEDIKKDNINENKNDKVCNKVKTNANLIQIKKLETKEEKLRKQYSFTLNKNTEKEYVEKLLDNCDDSLNDSLYSLAFHDLNESTSSSSNYYFPRKRLMSCRLRRVKKSYLNETILDESLRKPTNKTKQIQIPKPKPDQKTETRKKIQKKIMDTVEQVIIEENDKENNENEVEDVLKKEKSKKINNNVLNYSKKKSKNLRFSLSFGQDDEESEMCDFSISKVESKHSLFDIDEELKEIELGHDLQNPSIEEKNSKEIKVFGFGGDSGNIIFGDKEGSNINNSVQDPKDILSQLKKLNPNSNVKNNNDKNVNNDKENNSISINKQDGVSFRDKKNDTIISCNETKNKNEEESKNNDSENFLSFKSDSDNESDSIKKVNEYILKYYNDNIKISKIKKFDKEEFNDIEFIEKKRSKTKKYYFIKDIGYSKKLRIDSNFLNTQNIEIIETIRIKKFLETIKEDFLETEENRPIEIAIKNSNDINYIRANVSNNNNQEKIAKKFINKKGIEENESKIPLTIRSSLQTTNKNNKINPCHKKVKSMDISSILNHSNFQNITNKTNKVKKVTINSNNNETISLNHSKIINRNASAKNVPIDKKLNKNTLKIDCNNKNKNTSSSLSTTTRNNDKKINTNKFVNFKSKGKKTTNKSNKLIINQLHKTIMGNENYESPKKKKEFLSAIKKGNKIRQIKTGNTKNLDINNTYSKVDSTRSIISSNSNKRTNRIGEYTKNFLNNNKPINKLSTSIGRVTTKTKDTNSLNEKIEI